VQRHGKESFAADVDELVPFHPEMLSKAQELCRRLSYKYD
jgi:hypothetical protein